MDDKVFLLNSQSESILPIVIFLDLEIDLIKSATSCELCIKTPPRTWVKYKNPNNFGKNY